MVSSLLSESGSLPDEVICGGIAPSVIEPYLYVLEVDWKWCLLALPENEADKEVIHLDPGLEPLLLIGPSMPPYAVKSSRSLELLGLL